MGASDEHSVRRLQRKLTTEQHSPLDPQDTLPSHDWDATFSLLLRLTTSSPSSPPDDYFCAHQNSALQACFTNLGGGGFLLELLQIDQDDLEVKVLNKREKSEGSQIMLIQVVRILKTF